MEKVVRAVVLVNSFLLCNAILDLTGTHEIEGVWKSSTILPCIYVPIEDFNQKTVVWTLERDQTRVTVIQRDLSGDHTLLTQYRGRVSIQKEIPGNVSLQIKKLEIPDSGHYTCKVTWRAQNDSLITKEVTTTFRVVKVAVSKPIITPGHLGLAVPEGARASLTCSARGSPPISYQWFKGEPGGSAVYLSNQAELVFDPLQSSDVGKYYCQAENRARSLVTEQSDVVQLTVKDFKETMTTSPSIETTAHAATIPDYEQDLQEPRITSNSIETMVDAATTPDLEEDEDLKMSHKRAVVRSTPASAQRTIKATRADGFVTLSDLKGTMRTSPSTETMAHASIIPDYEQDLQRTTHTSRRIEDISHSTTIPDFKEDEDLNKAMPTTAGTEVTTLAPAAPDHEKDEALTVSHKSAVVSSTPASTQTTLKATRADLTTTVLDPNSGLGDSGRNSTTTGAHRTSLSLGLVILIAVLCASVVFLVITIISCRKKNR